MAKVLHKTSTPVTPERQPDKVMQIGGTSIKIFGPGVLSDSEREVRHRAIVRAVAACLKSQSQ